MEGTSHDKLFCNFLIFGCTTVMLIFVPLTKGLMQNFFFKKDKKHKV